MSRFASSGNFAPVGGNSAAAAPPTTTTGAFILSTLSFSKDVFLRLFLWIFCPLALDASILLYFMCSPIDSNWVLTVLPRSRHQAAAAPEGRLHEIWMPDILASDSPAIHQLGSALSYFHGKYVVDVSSSGASCCMCMWMRKNYEQCPNAVAKFAVAVAYFWFWSLYAHLAENWSLYCMHKLFLAILGSHHSLTMGLPAFYFFRRIATAEGQL